MARKKKTIYNNQRTTIEKTKIIKMITHDTTINIIKLYENVLLLYCIL